MKRYLPPAGPGKAGYFSSAIAVTIVEWKALTLYEWSSLIVSTIGFAAIVVTLYLMYRENKISDRAQKEGVLVPLKLQQLEIDKIFIEQPHLRKYFYENAPMEAIGSTETAQALAMAEYILDHFAAILPHTTVTGHPLTSTIWRNYLRDSFANSQVLSATLLKRKEWYPTELLVIQREASGIESYRRL